MRFFRSNFFLHEQYTYSLVSKNVINQKKQKQYRSRQTVTLHKLKSYAKISLTLKDKQ